MFILINRITLSECVFMGKSYSMHPEVLNGKVTMRGKGPVASEFPIFLLLGFFYMFGINNSSEGQLVGSLIFSFALLSVSGTWSLTLYLW